jgi:hypothetical protein
MVHSVLLTVGNFVKRVKELTDGPIKDALQNLVRVFSINQLRVYGSSAVESGAISQEHFRLLREVYDRAIEDLSRDHLVLVEGLGFKEDFLLNSCLS